MKLIWIPVAMMGLFTCEGTSAEEPISPEDTTTEAVDPFADYWYNGEAEISSYALRQMRYGEARDGDAVLVFVTEPFSESKQVKLDNAEAAGDDNVSVLKLNQLRKFNTGIYDYSVMTSVFHPVQFDLYPYPLKLTNSIQEWCGQTFLQLNLEGGKYRTSGYSYFESEGDVAGKVKAAMTEDALFTHLRLHKGQLPEGELDLIPSLFYTRMKHTNLRKHTARISKQASEKVATYIVEYYHFPRTLKIEVEQTFPYAILGWQEEEGTGSEKMVTRAELKKRVNEPYWQQNGNEYAPMRVDLGLGR